MKVSGRPTLFAVAISGIVAAFGCGSDDDPPPFGGYAPSYYGASVDVFHDDAEANRQLAIGELPTKFVDHVGNPVDIESYRDDKNLVIVVSRGIPQSPGGVPCAFCVAQTNSLVGNYGKFQDRDTEVIVVFPGPTQLIDDFILQSSKTPELPFPLLLDRDLKACEALGIRGDLAKPSTYILDKAGNIVYAYVGESMTDRPSLKAVFRVLDRLEPPTPGGSTTPASGRTPRSQRGSWLDRAVRPR